MLLPIGAGLALAEARKYDEMIALRWGWVSVVVVVIAIIVLKTVYEVNSALHPILITFTVLLGLLRRRDSGSKPKPI